MPGTRHVVYQHSLTREPYAMPFIVYTASHSISRQSDRRQQQDSRRANNPIQQFTVVYVYSQSPYACAYNFRKGCLMIQPIQKAMAP
jgi:hypothetical protein